MRRRGFTLIELLVVVAILAILAAAIVPIFSTSREAAKKAKAKADMDAIKQAAVMMHYDTGYWPPAGSNGTATCLINCTNTTINPSSGSSWEGPYLDDWRNDPWGGDYNIYVNGSALYVNCSKYPSELVLLITSNTSK